MQLAVHETSWEPPDKVLLTLVNPNEASPSSAHDIQLSTIGAFTSSGNASEPPFIGAAVREEDALRAAAALAEAAIARLMGVTRRLLPLSQLLQKNLLRLQTHR